MEFGPEIAADNGGVKLPWLTDDELVMCNWDDHAKSGPYAVRHIEGWTNGFRIRLPADHWAYPVIAKGFTPWAGGDEAPGDWDGGQVIHRDGGTYNAGPVRVDATWARVGEYNDVIGYRRKAATDDAFCSTEHAPEPVPTFKAGDYVVYTTEFSNYVVGNVYRTIGDQIVDDDGNYRVWFQGETRPATPAEIEQHLAEKALVAQYEGEPLPATVPTVELPVMTEEEVRKGFLAVFDADGFATAEDDCVTYLRTLGLIKPAPTPLEAFEASHGGLSDSERGVVEAFIAWQETQA